MATKDRLLSDEELREALIEELVSMKYQTIKPEGLRFFLNGLTNLINTQKRLYAESVIGEDEDKPLLKDATHMTQGLEVKYRNSLRAEQRSRINEK